MKNIKISLRDGEDYIKLVQAMKKSKIVVEGSDANYLIENAEVFVNGNVETRRGRKLRVKDNFRYKDIIVEII